MKATKLLHIIGILVVMIAVPVQVVIAALPEKAKAPRKITTKEYVSYPPVFARKANTLDPIKIVRDARSGYLAKSWEPWGMLPGLKPTYRFWFDNEALPWPELKHHVVDGFDNNNRNMGAHALLREMLGDEKEDDPVEAGHLAYLMTVVDPVSGIPYGSDQVARICSLGHGELCKNMILLYEQTGEQWMKDWVKQMLDTLRAYAHVTDLEGVGPIAEYWQGGMGGQGGFFAGTPPLPVNEKPENVALDGWQHLYNGWNAHAFSKWHELTGEKDALDFAVALANRLMNSGDEYGDDGSFRPDGSFGSIKGIAGSLHGHSHTHCLPGLIHLGGQLLTAKRKTEGFRMINQAAKVFEFLYDRTRNPDAGSMTGWIPEFLSVNGGETWKDRHGDAEGCTIGDVVQTAAMLGEASRFDASLAHLVDYYDKAEQIFRGQTVESIFYVTPQYLALVKKSLQKQVKADMPTASNVERVKEVAKRYSKAQEDAKRMEGRLLGLCGFPDWVNNLKYEKDPSLPRINMMGCCADAIIRAAHAIWAETVTGDARETRVNLAFNRESSLVDVISCLPHRGEVNVMVRKAHKVLVRVPSWAPKEKVKAYVDKKPVPLKLQGSYVVFGKVKKGQQLTVTYPLRIAEVKEVIKGVDFVEYTEKWRGNTIVDISPPGKWLPMFQRPELDTSDLP